MMIDFTRDCSISTEDIYDDLLGISVFMTNLTFTDTLTDESSDEYKTLKDEVTETVFVFLFV